MTRRNRPTGSRGGRRPAGRGDRRGAPPPPAPAAGGQNPTTIIALVGIGVLLGLSGLAIFITRDASPGPAPTPIAESAPTGEVELLPSPATLDEPADPDEPMVAWGKTLEPPPLPPAPAPSAAASPAAASLRARETVVVKRVVDGDTIELEDGRKVRYIGINTPERDTLLYDEATKFNATLVEGKRIEIELGAEPRDQYGRTLAHIWLGTELVNESLVREGFAYCYTWEPNTRYRDRLIAAQREARGKKLGVWGLPPPAPEDFYLAGERDHRFHRPECTKIGRGERRRFGSREEAFDAGLNAADRCCKP